MLLPYRHQIIDDADVAAVVSALRSDWLTTALRRGVRKLIRVRPSGGELLPSRSRTERRRFMRRPLPPAWYPCTSAITTPLTFAATRTASAISAVASALPTCRPTRSYRSRARRGTDGPDTRAIVAVDYTGRPQTSMSYGTGPSRRRGLIEGSAHALGGSYKAARRIGRRPHHVQFPPGQADHDGRRWPRHHRRRALASRVGCSKPRDYDRCPATEAAGGGTTTSSSWDSTIV